MNNMLRARLLRDLPSRKWVVEIPGIMLALNAMVHEPHGFSASMIATGREPSLPPDLDNGPVHHHLQRTPLPMWTWCASASLSPTNK